MQPEAKYKIVILGEGRVGKTSMLLRYCEGIYNEKQSSTINVTFMEKVIRLDNGKEITLSIWDTAGQEMFHAMAPLYYRDAIGAIIVYDVTSRESFQKVLKYSVTFFKKSKQWVDELHQFGLQDTEIVIAGNKCDMIHQVQISQIQGEEYSKSQGLSHFLTSAKSNIGIEQMFKQLAQQIFTRKQKCFKPKKKHALQIDEQENIRKQRAKTKKKSCCL